MLFRSATRAGETRRVLVISSGWLALAGAGSRAAIVSVVDISEMTQLKRVNDEVSRLNLELANNMRQLKAAQDEIVLAGKLSQLGQLTATVAHEIRNPLGAVRTAAFLLERKTKGKELGIEPQLERINNGITRCDNIISQLLDFSRTKTLHCDLTDFDQWLGALLDEEAQKLPAAITIEYRPGLSGETFRFDAARMSRAIINLAANAAEAMAGKGDDPSKFACAEPRIIVESRSTAAGIEIDIRDNGPGIAAEHLQKIFEPLFTTKSFGTGLGLPAVQKIVDQHGGKLSIVSRPGEGACFTIALPREHAKEEAA